MYVEVCGGEPLEKVFRIISEETRETVESPATRALREGVIVGLANHTILIAADGTERPIDDSAAPIREQDGEIVGCVLVFRDVTERRQSEQALRLSEQELADFFEHSSVGLQWIGPDGTILRANLAQATMLGYALDEYVGRNIAEFHADRSLIEEAMARRGRGEVLHAYPAQMRCKDGSLRDVLINSNGLIEHGQLVRSRVITQDITELKRAQSAQAFLAAVVESSHDAIIAKSLNGIVRSWNSGAERIFGYTAREAVGRHITFLIPPERLDEEDEFLRRISAGERIEHFESIRMRSDGERIPVSLTISPIRDQDGAIIGASKIARNISASKEAERALRNSEDRLRLALDAAGMGAWDWWTESGEVVWSPGLEAIYGLEPGSFSGSYEAVWQGVHPDDRKSVEESVQRSIDTGEDHHVVYRVVRPDGGQRWVEAKGRLFGEAGKPIRMAGVCLDITERKLAEDALRESDRRKDEFLALLAHELRNPLAPILSGLELMKGLHDPAQLEEIRGSMERQTKQLVALVDDLLDISRISKGKLRLRSAPVNLDDLIGAAVDSCRPLIDAKEHELTVEIADRGIMLHADPHRLAQVISNLLNNASQYTPESGQIGIRANRDGDDAVISVYDTGIGVPAEAQSRIFDLFEQVDTQQSGADGLGIGLSMVRSLVDMHGGSVEVRSDGVGKGSEFVVRLPALQEVADGEKTAPAAPAKPLPETGARVLVVDDNRAAAKMLSMVVEKLGYTVRTTYDGEAALEASAEFLPNVILMDLGMPGLDGYETARRLRRESFGANVALVALSGWAQAEHRRRTREAGFDRHMVKPIGVATLRDLLAQLAPGSDGA